MIGILFQNFICWIIYIIILLFSSSFLIPLFIWKSLVITYVRLFKSEIGEILNVYDTIFSVDYFYKRTYSTNVKIIILEGDLTVDMIRNGFVANVLSAVNEENQPRFPKLHQIPISIGGYFFWNKINVDLINSIRAGYGKFGPDPNNHDRELNIILGDLLSAPFQDKGPLWELVLFRGYKINQSVLIFRFHHSLGDGYSFNHLIDRMIQKTSKYTVKNQRKSCNAKASIMITGPKKIATLTKWAILDHDCYTNKKNSKTGVVSMTTLSLESMKRIRRVTKSHFATVGMTLLAGALRRSLLDRNQDGQQVPNFISILHSLPKPQHPITKMVNHWGIGIFKIPMEPPNALERLYQSEKDFASYMSAQYDELLRDHLFPMMALLPNQIIRIIFNRNHGTAIGLTNVPAYDKEAFLFGQHRILDIFKIFGLQWCQSALAAAIYTHNGKVSFTIYANKDILPDQAAVDKVTKEYLHDEFNELLHLCRLQSDDNNNNNNNTTMPNYNNNNNNNAISISLPLKEQKLFPNIHRVIQVEN